MHQSMLVAVTSTYHGRNVMKFLHTHIITQPIEHIPYGVPCSVLRAFLVTSSEMKDDVKRDVSSPQAGGGGRGVGSYWVRTGPLQGY